MRILIEDKPVTVTVNMETRQAPCHGCRHFERTEVAPPTCLVEGRGLSGSVVKACERFGWREAEG